MLNLKIAKVRREEFLYRRALMSLRRSRSGFRVDNTRAMVSPAVPLPKRASERILWVAAKRRARIEGGFDFRAGILAVQDGISIPLPAGLAGSDINDGGIQGVGLEDPAGTVADEADRRTRERGGSPGGRDFRYIARGRQWFFFRAGSQEFADGPPDTGVAGIVIGSDNYSLAFPSRARKIFCIFRYSRSAPNPQG